MVYIAQVLKRNRTLKVLNLSENKIDALGLISIAEALVSRFLSSATAYICGYATDISHSPRLGYSVV